MAEEAEIEENDLEVGEGAQADTPKKSKKKLFIIIGAAAFILIMGAGAAYFFLFASKDKAEEVVVEAVPAYFYDLDPITVNLSTIGDEDVKFLKLEISLELPNEEMLEIIVPRMPRVQDAFQVYLRELRASDLEGSAGIYRLKEELLRRVNLAIYPAKVDNILFKEILVQ
jgi:flagellar FliL protein